MEKNKRDGTWKKQVEYVGCTRNVMTLSLKQIRQHNCTNLTCKEKKKQTQSQAAKKSKTVRFCKKKNSKPRKRDKVICFVLTELRFG
jgi:hypothetical protein